MGEAEVHLGEPELRLGEAEPHLGEPEPRLSEVDARFPGLVEPWGKRFFHFFGVGRCDMASVSLAQFIESSRVLIGNARAVPELSTALAAYGYDEGRFAEGLRLLAEAEALIHRRSKEYGEQQEATAAAEQARAVVESAYMKSLKVARVALADEPLANASLKLGGPRKETLVGLIDQAGTFYANILQEPAFVAKMLRFGYTQQKILAEMALVEELRKRMQVQAREMGEAQAATMERDRKVAELDSWVADLRAIARVAFYESPQELEKLGILARSGPRARKPATAAAAPAAKA